MTSRVVGVVARDCWAIKFSEITRAMRNPINFNFSP